VLVQKVENLRFIEIYGIEYDFKYFERVAKTRAIGSVY